MSTWALTWRLITRRRLLYLGFMTGLLLFLVGRLVPGLYEQAIFDHLGSSHPVGLNIWTLIALMVSFELARLMAYLTSGFFEITVQYTSNALIQRNMLAAVLSRPGAAALSDSPEHTLNRFRDDAQDVALFTTQPVMLLGTFLFSLIAAFSALSLARKFSPHPLAATLLFLATPAFVINGNSLESDLPFTAFWLLAVALFVHAVDHRSPGLLAASSIASPRCRAMRRIWPQRSVIMSS